MNLSDLPPSLLISKMTYLPFKDVVSLCNTNTSLQEICTSDKYRNDWKSLIDDTYGNISYYQSLVKNNPNIKYDYLLYTDLINQLDPTIQLAIYEKQGDTESIKLVSRFILKSKINKLRPGKVLDVSRMNSDLTGIKMITRPGKASLKVGHPDFPIISSNKSNYDKVIQILGPEYEKYRYF